MKTRLLIFAVLILCSLQPLFSQEETYRQNLEKYWYYRERLKNDFIYYTGNADIPGSHQPAENRTYYGNGSDYIVFADGTYELGYYIGMLALEFKLLKDNGQDTSETELELNFALSAYDRLDRNAEPCFNNSNPDWNGFFLRDDMPKDDDRLNYFNVNNIKSGFILESDEDEVAVISQDQAIGLFFGLTMVHNFVPEFEQRSVEMASAIIARMHKKEDFLFWDIEWWKIVNPVNGETVPIGGGVGDLFSLCWAEAEAAGRITEEDEHISYSEWLATKEAWNAAQNNIMPFINGDEIFYFYDLGGLFFATPGIPGLMFWGYIPLPEFNANLIATLSTLVNESGGQYDNLYEWLMWFNDQTLKHFGMPEDVGVFPHLPLIAKLLYGYDGTELVEASFYKSHFFDTAPDCGAFHYFTGSEENPIEHVSDSPWHTMSLFFPWHNSGKGDEGGYYPMVDYMLINDAYLCDYYDDPKPYLLISEDNYPNDPVSVSVPRRIDAINQIYSNAEVTNVAGSEIHLLPGFHAFNGCNYYASIDPDLNYDTYFEKTTSDPCLQREFSKKQDNDTIPELPKRSEPIMNNWTTKNYQVNDSYPINRLMALKNTENNNSNLLIFPNPSSGIFYITLSEKDIINQIEVFNSYGVLILDCITITNNFYVVDLSNRSAGIYYLRLVCNNSIYRHKLIKK
jgi:hypothetical protein